MAADPGEPQEPHGDGTCAPGDRRRSRQGGGGEGGRTGERQQRQAGGPAMTVSAASFVPKTVYVTYIAAPPEKVWAALTEAEFTRRYFFGYAVEIDLRVGGSFILRTEDGSVGVAGE